MGVALASRRNNSVKMEHQVEEEVRGEKGPTSSSSIVSTTIRQNINFVLLEPLLVCTMGFFRSMHATIL